MRPLADSASGLRARRCGASLPWNFALVGVVALSLMFTRVTLDAEGSLANAHHLIGALTLTVLSIAAAEVARPARYLNVALGAVLLGVPFVLDADLRSLESAARLTRGACHVANDPYHERSRSTSLKCSPSFRSET